MNANEFETFLKYLQQNYYLWPDRYFAWEKPDGSLFMVSTQTTQLNELLIYEIDPFLEANRRQLHSDMKPHGKAEGIDEHIYSAHFYNISPSFTHMRGPHTFDPVSELVSKVSEYQYLGAWDNPQRYRRDDHGGGQVLNHSCWNEAIQNIRRQERKPSLSETIDCADLRAKAQSVYSDIPEKDLVR